MPIHRGVRAGGASPLVPHTRTGHPPTQTMNSISNFLILDESIVILLDSLQLSTRPTPRQVIFIFQVCQQIYFIISSGNKFLFHLAL